MVSLTPRPGVLDIAAYRAGKSRLPGVERVIRLASNESAIGPSPRAVAALGEAAGNLHRYPDPDCTALRAAIGDRWGLDSSRVVCGNGSDEVLSLLARAYAGPGDEILYSRHGFLMFPIIARTVGATPVTAPETNLTADVDALLAQVTPRTRVLFLANPNNPTGSYLDREALMRLRERLPGNVLLVIDSAYAEFVVAPDYIAGAELVEDCDNVVMTRTFSKIYALAALRLGWAYAPPAIVEVLNRMRSPFNVNAAAQATGIAALRDVDFTAAAVEHNRRWSEWLRSELTGLGLEVRPSVANFLLVRFPGDNGQTADAANSFLAAHGIIPREVADYGLPGCLRITIGLEDEMRALVAALAGFMEGDR
jgi:histidinol-phosphate aminotransferase